VTENDEVRPGSGFRLEPWGLLYRYAREGETQPVEERRSLWERYRTAAAGNVSEDSGYLARVLASSYPLQRSRQSFLEGREEEGRALLEEALRVGEGIGPVENNVALALERAGDVPAARALYAKAERGADGRLPTLNLARLDRAEGRQDEARRRLEIVVREDPRLRYAALLEIGALELEEGDAERALESFRRASEERPWEPGPVVGMAEARLHAGDGEGARMLFARADAMRPGLARLGELRAADLLIENGRPGEAEAVYAALLEKNPADGETANRWAWLLAEEGRDLDHALRLVRSARGAEPANPSYADTEGWVLVRLGRPAEGAALLEEAARLGLSGPGVRFRLGIAHFRSGREELGRKEIEEALRDDPESPYAAEARNALEATAAARSRS
jgi:tetratricopeptide (TPR) repeat protein